MVLDTLDKTQAATAEAESKNEHDARVAKTVKEVARTATDLNPVFWGGLVAGAIGIGGPIGIPVVVAAKGIETVWNGIKTWQEAGKDGITLEDKPSQDLNGAWAGGFAGLMIPGGGPVTAAIGAAIGYFGGKALNDMEKNAIEKEQADLAVNNASATYNAGMIDAAANENLDGEWAKRTGGKRSFSPKAIIAQREQQAATQPQLG